MINIVVALRLCASEWANSAVKVFCDNWAVVQGVKCRKTRDAFLRVCSHNIWPLMVTCDTDLQLEQSQIYSSKHINSDLLQYLRDNFHWRKTTEHFLNLDLYVSFQGSAQDQLFSFGQPGCMLKGLTDHPHLWLIQDILRLFLLSLFLWPFPLKCH